jgi:hypothetical protein
MAFGDIDACQNCWHWRDMMIVFTNIINRWHSVECCKVAWKVCNKVVTNLCCSGYQPCRPALLKRKRAVSEDEVSYLYWLHSFTTNIMEQSPLQKLTVALLVKFLVYYRTWRLMIMFTTPPHWSLCRVGCLVHPLPCYFFESNFTILFSSVPWSWKWPSSFWFSHQNPVCTHFFSKHVSVVKYKCHNYIINLFLLHLVLRQDSQRARKFCHVA